MLTTHLRKLLKEIQYRSPFRHNFFPKYSYNFSVPQLLFLCQCVIDVRDVEGAMTEVGCHNGATTVFLNVLMNDLGIDKKYYAIDTFSGFTSSDIDFEVNQRGKSKELFDGAFQVNSKKWFDATMRQNNITRVESIKADVNNYDLTKNAPYSFALLDVDLYKPMIKCLRELYDGLSPDGIIVIDDCNEKDIRWDGSDQAYKEFAKEVNQPVKIVHNKLGVLKKPSK
ncbi:MAG TPA: TylF/MycF/NovP-related O-methyltransferase [Phototrophicaceae bacterium]|nr:TylF/MycF/NovP-related O-methyltransferase [Phototrophicaceae bacterium]